MGSGGAALSESTVRRAAAAVLLGLLAATAACTSPKGIKALPPAPTTLPTLPPTTIVDYSGVGLKGVTGRTTTTIPMGPGHSTVSGVVAGPEGPVAGATVRAERLVGDGAAVAQVVTAADGTWNLANVLGGRYRIRAWRPLDLALVKPQVFFLNDGDKKQVQLVLTRYDGLAVNSAIAPNPPVVGDLANLVVQVVQQSVDPTGVVRGEPVANVSAELFGGGDWSVSTSNPTVTDSQGQAHWQVRCRSAGGQRLAVVVGSQQQFPLDLPACEAPPDTTTSSSTSSTSSSSSSSSSTPTSR